VKIPSRNVSELSPEDFRVWIPRLRARLEKYQPEVACFHGVMAYRPFARYALGLELVDFNLGLQPQLLGRTHLYVVPNPSPANAHFKLEDQVFWYNRLSDYLDSLEPGA
jgi:TDG/mug DNA glycosylase family protein